EDMAEEFVTSRRSESESQAAAVARPPAVEIPEQLARRTVVDRVRPSIDAGRFPIKRTIAESVQVSADILADGHDVIAAVLRDRRTINAEDAEHSESNNAGR